MNHFSKNEIMNLQKNLLALTLSAFSTISFADVNSCASFLTLGTYNLAQSGNDSDADLFKKASFCASEYNAKSEQAALIESAYSLLGGSDLAGISDAQKRLCSGFGSDIYIGKTAQSTQNIFQDSIQEWNNCKTLAQKGVDFVMQPARNLQSFSFTLSTSLGNQEKFLGLTQGGSGRSICKATLPARNSSALKSIAVDETTALPFDFNNKLQITCNRQMQKDSNGDLSAEAQTLELKTGKGTYQVEVEAIGALSKMSVDKVIADVQESIKSKICTGTSVTSDKWNLDGKGADVTIDTSKCRFTKTPQYFASIIGASGGMWQTRGVQAIYYQTSNSFLVYVVSPDIPIEKDWVINWVAIQE